VDPEPGEQVFFHGHPSWRSIVSFYVKALVGVVLAGALAGLITDISSSKVSVGWIVGVALVGFVAMLVWGLILRIQTTYTITNRRLTIDTGILRKELHQTRLERVQNVNTEQSVVDRLLRVGKVSFDTAGEAGYDFSFRGVSNPHGIVHTVDRALRELQQTGSGL
jgi:uncharacterized membrane protein YdbT with pleckstrin-like domain